jgi:hypothetical protein
MTTYYVHEIVKTKRVYQIEANTLDEMEDKMNNGDFEDYTDDNYEESLRVEDN